MWVLSGSELPLEPSKDPEIEPSPARSRMRTFQWRYLDVGTFLDPCLVARSFSFKLIDKSCILVPPTWARLLSCKIATSLLCT